METSGEKNNELNLTKSEKEFTNMMIDCINVEGLKEFDDYQPIHITICEDERKKYLFYHYACIVFFVLMIISIFPVTFFHWAIFVVSEYMFITTYNNREYWKGTYEFNCGLFNLSEYFIKEGRKNLYGI